MPLALDITGNHALALTGDALGYRLVPCAPGTKVPLVKWKRFQEERPTADLYERWFRGTRNNIALLTEGLVLFDCDDPALADRVIAECGDTPHKIRTPRGGIHLGYRKREGDEVRNRVRILRSEHKPEGEPIDIRTDGGLELLPHSRTTAGAYSWLGEGLIPIAALPIANIAWTRDRSRERTRRTLEEFGDCGCATGSVRFPERYCLRIQSLQGQNGSRGLVRMVCVMRDAGRTPDQALRYALTVWNPTCADPPWSENEIRHAIRRHYGIADF